MTCKLSNLKKPVLNIGNLLALIHFFFQYLKSVDLSGIKDKSKLNLILELLQIRCQNLSKITYNGGGMRTKKDEGSTPEFSKFFRPFIEVLNIITHLNLENTKLNDTDLSLIGANGQNLKLLNICDSKDVSEAGFYCLFLPQNLDGQPDSSYGHCKHLEYLDIRGTEIPEGAISRIYLLHQTKFTKCLVDNQYMLMLEIIRQLCSNDNDDLEDYHDSIVVNMAQTMASMAPKLHIDELCLQNYPLTLKYGNKRMFLAPQLEIALVMASNVKKVTLCLQLEKNNSIQDLKLLGSLKNITNLDITLHDEPSSEEVQLASTIFTEELIPIFLSIGHQLTYLRLSGLIGVDAGIIINYCPNLEKLYLEHNGWTDNPITINLCNIKSNYPLKSFRMWNFDFCLPHVFIKFLGYCTMLNDLSILGLDSFNDELMEEICELNPFHHLVNLELFRLDELTIESFEESILKNPCVPLKRVTLNHCREITKADAQRVEKFMKSKKYNCDVIWS